MEQERTLAEDDVAEIVHDLKSPLSAISLETVLLAHKLEHGDRRSGMHSLERINRNLEYLDRLVLDLLDACSVSGGELHLDAQDTELGALLADVLARIGAGARIVLDASEPVHAIVDRVRIQRVVANLLDNAIKYAASSSQSIVVRLTCDRRTARVSIIDSGPGIAASELPHIFRRHCRAATSRGRSGSGLGLYVCKKIVEAHGGTIGVESESGVGSHFYFELPTS